MRYEREKIQQILSWKLEPYLFCLRFIPAKWKQSMGIFNMPPFCLDSVTMEFLSFPFLCTRTFLASYKHAHSFCRDVLAEREKLDFSVVFSKAGFLSMDIEIVLMKANKGRTTGSILSISRFFSLFKIRIENQSKLRALRNYCPRGSSFIPCQNFTHEFGIFRKKKPLSLKWGC